LTPKTKKDELAQGLGKESQKTEYKKKDVDDLKELEEKFKEVEQEAKETHDRLLRVSAEFENFKKRSSRQMSEFKKYANESLLLDILAVVDNLDRAIDFAANDEAEKESLIEGVKITIKEIFKIFEKYSVKPIKAMGETFDPAFHQAIMNEESDKYSENTVINELQKGYMIHDRLLRPAMVVVSVKKKKDEDDEE